MEFRERGWHVRALVPFKWAAMGWAERVRADPPSRPFAGVGWEAAGVAPTHSVPLGKLLCRSRRPSLEVVVVFFPSLGCVGKLSPKGGTGPPCSSGSVWGATVWTLACGWAVQPLGLRTGLAGRVPKGRLRLWRGCCTVVSCFFLPWI